MFEKWWTDIITISPEEFSTIFFGLEELLGSQEELYSLVQSTVEAGEKEAGLESLLTKLPGPHPGIYSLL